MHFFGPSDSERNNCSLELNYERMQKEKAHRNQWWKSISSELRYADDAEQTNSI